MLKAIVGIVCLKKRRNGEKKKEKKEADSALCNSMFKLPFVISQWYLIYLFPSYWLRDPGFSLNALKEAYGFFFVSHRSYAALRFTDSFHLF